MNELAAGDPPPTYQEVGPRKFRFGIVRRVIDLVLMPLMFPLALLGRRSDALFRTASEWLSLAPYVVGVHLRRVFYRHALRSCGRNLVVEFGAVFVYPDISVGDDVLIGRFSVIHECDLGDYVLLGERCTLLSGARQHRFARTDVPMALQGGQRKRISVGRDCWVGSHAVVMEDVGSGAIVGAGAVVNSPVPELAIVAGNPAKVIRHRDQPE